jgi:hypothetical protein
MGQAAGRLVRRCQLYHHGLVNAKQLSRITRTTPIRPINGQLSEIKKDTAEEFSFDGALMVMERNLCSFRVLTI